MCSLSEAGDPPRIPWGATQTHRNQTSEIRSLGLQILRRGPGQNVHMVGATPLSAFRPRSEVSGSPAVHARGLTRECRATVITPSLFSARVFCPLVAFRQPPWRPVMHAPANRGPGVHDSEQLHPNGAARLGSPCLHTDNTSRDHAKDMKPSCVGEEHAAIIMHRGLSVGFRCRVGLQDCLGRRKFGGWGGWEVTRRT